MKKLAIILFSLFLISCSEEKPKPAAKEISKAEVEAMYKGLCSLCHGPDGTMAFGGAKDLSESQMTLGERIAIIRYGKGTMTPFDGRLSDAEIKALAEYIETFRK